MGQRIIIDTKDDLVEGEILQFKDGKIRSVEIHELLPDLTIAKRTIEIMDRVIGRLESRIVELEAKVKELRGED